MSEAATRSSGRSLASAASMVVFVALIHMGLSWWWPRVSFAWWFAIAGSWLGWFACRQGLAGRRSAWAMATWTLIVFAGARIPAVAAAESRWVDAVLESVDDSGPTSPDPDAVENLRIRLQESSSWPALWYGSLSFLDLVFLLMGTLLVYRFVARAPVR